MKMNLSMPSLYRRPFLSAKWSLLALIALIGSTVSSLHAAGGGENMLLVVNPSDEPSLRIANAYVKARNIPLNNILYISGGGLNVSEANFLSLYRTPIAAAIAARGLTNQIDYIGTIGLPHTVQTVGGAVLSLNDCLNHLTQLQNGMTCDQINGRSSELLQNPPPYSGAYTYVTGSNKAIYHSQQFVSGTNTPVQWYMSGLIGYSGQRGLTTSQAVQNLQRTVSGDGKKPFGTVYFEDSQEIRTSTRSPYWPPIQAYLDSVGIPWIQELGITPKNRSTVRGAVVGSASPTLATQIVNGSAYLPGSWADDLTSFGGSYNDSSQTKVSHFLLGGAAGAAGTVNEPYAVQSRFNYASIFVFSNDGSSLGEAFYKSVQQPDLLMFQGDLLSQPYADIPVVTFTAGPADGDTVSGAISLSASAVLNNPRIATGIASLKLFVDGLPSGSAINAASGSFNLDTTALTDGIHEVRIVAYNNSLAASEGYSLKNLVVNNKGQSVIITGTSSYSATWNQVLSIPVSARQSSGPTITSIDLQLLGRSVASLSALSGTISLDVTKLAYGSNIITPVAILSSGSQQVQGAPITITRRFLHLPGTPPTPVAKRNPGCDYYFFSNAAGSNSTLSTINFNATPAYALHGNSLGLSPGNTYSPSARNFPDFYKLTYTGYQMAAMIKSNFTVSAAGEYLFNPSFGGYSSAGLYIDGNLIAKNDSWNTTTNTWTSVIGSQSLYLLPGEHSLMVKLGQSRNGRVDSECSFSLIWRGPDGNTNGAGAPTFYTTGKRLSP